MQARAWRVLVIDDTQADRLAVRFVLEQKRNPTYVIAELARGGEAISACRDFQPDCVLLDFKLQDWNGLEILSQLRQQFGPLKFAIVMLTGSGDEMIAVEALKQGAQDYIPKAYLTGDLLERAIQNGLDKLTLERQRVEAEDALAANERKLRHVINAAPCALYTVDLEESRPVYVSAFAETLIGYTVEEIDDMGPAGLLSMIHPDDRAAVQLHLRRLRLAAPEVILECNFRIQRKDQSWRWVSVLDRVVGLDANGVVSVVAGAATDITARRQMEDDLRASQAQLLVAQEAAGIGTWSWDLEGNRMDSSPLLRKLYGREGESAGMDMWAEWLHPEDRARVASEVSHALKGAPFQTEFRAIWPDGNTVWLRSQGKLIDGAGRPPRFLGANLDVTEKRKTEEELRRSNDELERFAYVASHDLQEPLRTILSFSELFARRNKDVDQESKQFLEYVRQGGQRMQALISDLLTFSRVTQASQDPLEAVDANEVLGEALNSLGASIRESGAVVEAGSLPVLTANFQQLTQLLQNLIGNAIKYRGGEAPRIRVACVRVPRFWQFAISDNGIGFDMTYAERIFEAFKRLHSRDQFSGTGIGLAICKRIVERHGGRIWAESAPGIGSTFYFTVAEAVTPTGSESAPTLESSTGR